MKSVFMASVAFLAMTSLATAEESMTDKAATKMEKAGDKTKEVYKDAEVGTKKAARKAKRTAKQGMNRIEEATCMEGDMKCAARKAGNRMEEGKDAAVDAAKDASDTMKK
ncbi:hypothetical protein AB1A81_07360 [Bdellovibrio bacteriovorus]|uniref:Late embryogenesis abundant protein n=1 Tax=Bdellovibrio bacteriovorus (strain ATCC 15356 / DSM 50701 / NCIMB 9529 / HD100) TaxID=264462 RepID=Q6MML2_BDEBA|nr:hypothetical protein [Bdellovibrio bacteriovorus]AHZ84161.1 hypothetical protein EP01_04285 [Bdellovibrio bacteriovorus]BEV68045.1 hypothetical protein Bb109J_c1465 [Bdellovibrio bacteriovorus]CAE79492.1 hypothetical protein predicted by Glimmer/Critica [Bdellovibrio bacteriovorus HD100]